MTGGFTQILLGFAHSESAERLKWEIGLLNKLDRESRYSWTMACYPDSP